MDRIRIETDRDPEMQKLKKYVLNYDTYTEK